jgi:hypothetical protein
VIILHSWRSRKALGWAKKETDFNCESIRQEAGTAVPVFNLNDWQRMHHQRENNDEKELSRPE